MQISENLVYHLLGYLEGQSDPLAKVLHDQLRYCLELHNEAFEHPESKGVYQIPLPDSSSLNFPGAGN